MMQKGRIEVTRGKGVLEGFLARQRLKIANRKIPNEYRKGRLLDIGCGAYPYFLLNTDFTEKYGIEKIFHGNDKNLYPRANITIIHHDIEENPILPLENEYIDVVTMLAVFEHIKPGKLVAIINEIFRILKPNGLFVMTTPAGWTNPLLKVMAAFRLVSRIEIEEHKDTHTHRKILSLMQKTNFSVDKIRYGYFEIFSNLWLVAKK
jgi:SAM-dependent methyltransferase